MPLTPERVWRAIQDAKAEGGVRCARSAIAPLVMRGLEPGDPVFESAREIIATCDWIPAFAGHDD